MLPSAQLCSRNGSTSKSYSAQEGEETAMVLRDDSIKTTSTSYAISAAPSYSHSLVLSRLARSPTLLPENLASLITSLSLVARFSIRASALMIECVLESLRFLSMGSLGVTRRALVSAVGSARALHYLNSKLDWAGRNEAGEKTNDTFLAVLDKYTNVGVYLIHHTFSLAELFALSGFYLTLSTLQTGFAAAEESVRMLDGLFGSTETSRALSSIITLARNELTNDPRFSPAERGAIASLTALTKALTAFICLQAVTHKRTLKEMRMRVIYDCTILVEEAQKEFSLASDKLSTSPDSTIGGIPSGSGMGRHRRESSRASETGLMTDVLSEIEASKNHPRTRPTSVVEESMDIVEELEKLCAADEEEERESQSGVGNELPPEVMEALRQVQEGQLRGGKGKRVVRTGEGIVDYEIEVEETTTTTTTVLRAVDTRSTSARTISRNTRPRGRPLSVAQRKEERVVLEEVDVQDDEWEELVTSSIAGSLSGTGESEDEEFEDAEIPSATNGAPSLAAITRQDALEHPKESREKLQLVLRTMTRKFTQRKRTIRRLDTPEGSDSPARSTERGSGKVRKRDMVEWPRDDDEETETSGTITPKAKSSGSGGGVLRVLSKALKKPSPATREGVSFFSSPSPSISRKSSSTSMKDSSLSLESSPPPLPPLPPPPVPPLPSTIPIQPQRHSATLLNPPPAAPTSRLRRVPSAQSMRSVVTTMTTHASAAPAEEQPKPSSFPQRHLVENLQYFMRSSSAAYGQTFLRILGIGKHDFNFPNTQTHANNHAFAHHVGIDVDNILLSSYTDAASGLAADNTMSPIVNYVAVDHAINAIVLSCRGSLGLSDILTDLTCDYESISVEHGVPGASYYVHSGIHHAAQQLRHGTVKDTIREALERYPNYGLVICGHSLGGGVAALLSVIWASPRAAFERQVVHVRQAFGRHTRHPPITTPFVTSFSSGLPPGRPIASFCFGPPCVASPDLVKYCRGLVTSTIHNYDLVPTLSLGVLRDLKNMAMGLNGESGTAEEIVGRVIGLWQRRFMASRHAGDRSRSSTPTTASAPQSSADMVSGSSLIEISDEAREVPLTGTEIQNGRGTNKALDPAYRDPSLLGPEVSDDEELQNWLWSLVKTLRAGNEAEKLYPPGDVYIIESWTVFISESAASSEGKATNAKYSRREGRRVLLRAVDDVEKRFSEPIFGRSMMSDHSPRSYEQSLDDLATAIVG